ncbi:MAG: sigma 54-interacting transcriptional regulator [Eubacteriales bacterium]|nr:sigma 54-interacting transcriptional regulator [Eubacteriales bacterium]
MDILLEDVLDSMDDPIYILNKNADFIFVNKALVEMSGYSRNELLAFNALELEKKGTIDRSVTKTVLQTKQKIIACQHVTKKNKVVNKLMITQTPIFEADGEIKYLIGVLKNVSDINEHYREAVIKNEVTVFHHKDEDTTELAFNNIIAESTAMKRLLESVSKLASYDTSILILGESGTGKEVIANYIHNISPRSEKNLVKINCASLPETLLEAELFGYEKGSFTGALETGKVGLVETAHNGTLFLDEIDSLPLLLQGKLLRVLETKMIKKIGSVKEIHSDFRLITATNADLDELVKKKQFRQDLYFRLNVVPIRIPSLRERPYDIIPLAIHFLKDYCRKYNKTKYFSKNVFDIMLNYDWPGNVRELKNFIERMVVMSSTSVIELQDIPKGILTDFSLKENDFSLVNRNIFRDLISDKNYNSLFDLEHKTYKELMEEYEEELIKHAMEKYKTTYKAAEVLGVNQSTIARKTRKYDFK